MGGGVLLFQRQVVIFTVFEQFGQFKQPTVKGALAGDHHFLHTAANGEKGNAPVERVADQRQAQFISPRIGVRLIAVFTIKVRLHITGAARQQNTVEVLQQFFQQFGFRQRVWQGDWQPSRGHDGI